MPRVSVILTSFNHDRYIREAIDSVLRQTFYNWELIVIDDASTDKSWQIIQTYHDPRIKYFQTEYNGQITFRINDAIRNKCAGDLIAIHHSDDSWEPSKLEVQVKTIDESETVGVVFTNARPIVEDGTDLLDETNFYHNIFDQPNRSRHEWLRHFFLVGNALCHPSALIRKSCFDQCGYLRPSLRQLDDLDLWIRFALKYELHIIPDKLTRFRVRSQTNEIQVSGNNAEARLRSAYEAFSLLENYTHISGIEELSKVFPESKKYIRAGGEDLIFVLGMVMLESATVPMARLFALELLRKAVTDPARSDNIHSLYGFGTAELVQLTGKYDVFSLEEVAVLRAMIEERDAKIERLQAVASQSSEKRPSIVVPAADRDPLQTDLERIASDQSIDAVEGSWPSTSLETLRDAWDSTSQVPTGGGASDTNETIFLFALATQRLHGAVYERMGRGSSFPLLIRGKKFSIEVNVYNSSVDLLRAIVSVTAGYVVLSPRAGLVWDQHLLDRVAIEIAEVEGGGAPWLCLCADGVDQTGKQHVSAHFSLSPSLAPDRGSRLINQTSGTLSVLKVDTYRKLGFSIPVSPEITSYLNALIVSGYARGQGSFFTSNLYPCIREYQSLSYQPLESLLAEVGDRATPTLLDSRTPFPNYVPCHAQVAKWMHELETALAARHSLSFVIRTLFRRGHLLRRCLISIEYLRRRIGLSVEIVLATDIDAHRAKHEILNLREEFPNLSFVTAQNAGGRGHSRVRNLVAGIRATTGSRVAIIDDDDYYTPQAVSCFQQACRFGSEALVIFDAQIVNEKWFSASKQWHRELLSYGERYHATNWANTLRGSNSIPLCGVIHPGWFVRHVADEYHYDYDLSEDFIFHVLCFSHSKRPPVVVIEGGVFAYQSHREGDDNVSTAADRTSWDSDTGNGLYQLLFERKYHFETTLYGPDEYQGLLIKIEALEAELSRARHGLAHGIANLVHTQVAEPSRKKWVSRLRVPLPKRNRH